MSETSVMVILYRQEQGVPLATMVTTLTALGDVRVAPRSATTLTVWHDDWPIFVSLL